MDAVTTMEEFLLASDRIRCTTLHKKLSPCTLHKARANIRAPLVPLTLKSPMQIVAMDFLTLSRPTDRYQNSLVVTDLFTKYAWATPTPDQTALTTAHASWTHMIQPFGCSEMFHSDQGPNFEW